MSAIGGLKEGRGSVVASLAKAPRLRVGNAHHPKDAYFNSYSEKAIPVHPTVIRFGMAGARARIRYWHALWVYLSRLLWACWHAMLRLEIGGQAEFFPGSRFF